MQFSENLRNLRKEKDFSQEYLAEKLGVSRQTISKWENATAMPDLKKLTEIAELFEIGINDLLGLDVSAENENKNNTIQIEYSSQKFEAKIQELTQKNNNMKTALIITSISIILLAVILIVTNINISSNVNSLRSQINNIQPQVVYRDSEEKYDNYTFDCVITAVNKDKHNMVTLDISYIPDRITKNAVVYFVTNGADGTEYKINAEQKNNIYSGTGEIDVRNNGVFNIFVDDGKEVTKTECIFDLEEDFFQVIGQPTISYAGSPWGSATCLIDNSTIDCLTAKPIKLVSAKLETVKNGKITYSQDCVEMNTLDDDKYHNHYSIQFDEADFNSNNKNNTGEESIYILIQDDNGVKYTCYLEGNADEPFGRAVIDFDSAKTE
ncbi:MAG: helix-turn-helix domain-containing protein [Acetobacter sp.]|nr:helix-turn-helix domain-containing protein [Bacteroides sp.]MCM1340338.1 helix-turn-helix domain-containing protein [Acetobacter sp.]MCM1433015.1 helix-turn-helix domain-containing protein [Clostridiales bacterium]